MQALLWPALVVCAISSAETGGIKPEPRACRTEFTYKASVKDLPAGTKALVMWVPIPSNSEWQNVESVEIDGLSGHKITQERKYGNRMVYVSVASPQTPLALTVRFVVSRKEVRVLASDTTRPTPAPVGASSLRENLKSETRLPTGGRYDTIAREVTASKSTTMEKARAIFNHVVDTVQYDYKQESPKYGEGDSDFVCDYKKGDCTDIHSYMISLMRSVGIPIVHEFGLPLGGIPLPDPMPTDTKITSYHCYACFYDPAYGWIPADASDARRWIDHNRPEMRDYLFGNLVLERNGVAISRGRNLILAPPQKGEPLNKFIYPYAEADGKAIKVDLDLTRRTLGSPSNTAH